MKKILIKGVECFVTDTRVKPSERVEGYTYYCLRHGDDFGIPLSIEPFVLVNMWGTLATKANLSKHAEAVGPKDSFEIKIKEEELSLLMSCSDGSPHINEDDTAETL